MPFLIDTKQGPSLSGMCILLFHIQTRFIRPTVKQPIRVNEKKTFGGFTLGIESRS